MKTKDGCCNINFEWREKTEKARNVNADAKASDPINGRQRKKIEHHDCNKKIVKEGS